MQGELESLSLCSWPFILKESFDSSALKMSSLPGELWRFFLNVCYSPWPTAPQQCFVGLAQINHVRDVYERHKIRILLYINSFGSSFQSAAWETDQKLLMCQPPPGGTLICSQVIQINRKKIELYWCKKWISMVHNARWRCSTVFLVPRMQLKINFDFIKKKKKKDKKAKLPE